MTRYRDVGMNPRPEPKRGSEETALNLQNLFEVENDD